MRKELRHLAILASFTAVISSASVELVHTLGTQFALQDAAAHARRNANTPIDFLIIRHPACAKLTYQSI